MAGPCPLIYPTCYLPRLPQTADQLIAVRPIICGAISDIWFEVILGVRKPRGSKGFRTWEGIWSAQRHLCLRRGCRAKNRLQRHTNGRYSRNGLLQRASLRVLRATFPKAPRIYGQCSRPPCHAEEFPKIGKGASSLIGSNAPQFCLTFSGSTITIWTTRFKASGTRQLSLQLYTGPKVR